MNKDVKNMLKVIIIFIISISAVGSIILYFINKTYVWPFITGSTMAILSFTINSLTTSNVLSKNANKGLLFLSSIFRVLLVCIVGAVIAKNNMNEILPYILGYSVEFIGMFFYGLSLKKQI